MNRSVWILICALLFMTTQAGMAGEIYKYTDKSGNRIFTDDISKVPKERQAEMKTIQSIDSAPSVVTQDQTSALESSRQPDSISTEGARTPSDETTGETGQDGQTKNTSLVPDQSKSQEALKASEYQTLRDQFEKEKKRLDQQAIQLQTEKEQLSDTDLKNMTKKEIDELEEKQTNLNARIDQLKIDQSQLLERVRQFNERIKSRQTGKPEQTSNSSPNT
jgi:hypothetical protein